MNEHYLPPGRARLRSVSPTRMLTLQVAPDMSFVPDMPLVASPVRDDLAMAGPFTTREGQLRDGRLHRTPVTIRQQVVRIPQAASGTK